MFSKCSIDGIRKPTATLVENMRKNRPMKRELSVRIELNRIETGEYQLVITDTNRMNGIVIDEKEYLNPIIIETDSFDEIAPRMKLIISILSNFLSQRL